MCLICGFVGCGRYSQKHSLDHNASTNHNFAVELLSGRIWYYTGDCYVHRIVRTNLDTAMNEPSQQQLLDSIADKMNDENYDVSQLQMNKKGSGISEGKNNASGGKMIQLNLPDAN